MEKARLQGAEVILLTAPERQAFRDAVKPLHDMYRSVLGPEWYDFFTAKMGRTGVGDRPIGAIDKVP